MTFPMIVGFCTRCTGNVVSDDSGMTCYCDPEHPVTEWQLPWESLDNPPVVNP